MNTMEFGFGNVYVKIMFSWLLIGFRFVIIVKILITNLNPINNEIHMFYYYCSVIHFVKADMLYFCFGISFVAFHFEYSLQMVLICVFNVNIFLTY